MAERWFKSSRGETFMAYSIEKRVEAFFKKVQKTDGCWNWLGGRAQNSNGYGSFWNGTKLVPAHRYSYELVNGKIFDGLYCLHKCDNMVCVNPDHIFTGTQKQNMEDCKLKGRTKNIGRHSTKNGTRRLKIRKVKTKCKRGHDMSIEKNTFISHPKTYKTVSCRICRNSNERNRVKNAT